MESTYRIQLSPANSFSDIAEALDYFRKLGVTQLYLSPILRARAESTHGYDCVDPQEIHPKVGGVHSFEELLKALEDKPHLGLLLDIVPNHMAISTENPWWQDVLEQGPSSKWAKVFDLTWFREKSGAFYPVVLPFLGDNFNKLVHRKELSLGLHKNRLSFTYYEQAYPLEPRSYLFVFKYLQRHFGELLSWQYIEPLLEELRPLIESIPRFSQAAGEQLTERRNKITEFHERWFALLNQNQDFKSSLDQLLGHVSESKNISFFDSLLHKQVYRLEFWKTGSRNINYRRFFDINELVAVRIEDKDVFQETHCYIFELVENPQIKGLRVDHVDGLSAPAQYLDRLSASCKKIRPENPPQVYVEKILETHERTRKDWPIAGTTGYEFMNRLNGLFVNPEGFHLVEKDYKERTRQMDPAEAIQLRAKQYVLKKLFRPDFERLYPRLEAMTKWLPRPKKHSLKELFRGFEALSLSLPVYRTYIEELPISQEDQAIVEQTFALMKEHFPQIKPAVTKWWKKFFFEVLESSDHPPQRKKQLLDFVTAWQQITGPLMAKGHEDTFLYRYYPLASLNEVGGEPVLPENPDQLFHDLCQFQAEHFPLNINSTSTHDTKRGEDVRARLNVISDLPNEWLEHVTRWTELNRPHKSKVSGVLHPMPNTEVLIYQTLLGTWPMNDHIDEVYVDRIKGYLLKALREMKRYTSWREPENQIEVSAHKFVERILDANRSEAFLKDFSGFAKQISHYGIRNSLSQLALKLMAPGVPDLYFGSELWNFRLVDPDNREPVDFQCLSDMLDELPKEASEAQLREMLNNWSDGRIKLFLTRAGLQLRQEFPDLFSKGSYEALHFSGPEAPQLIGFQRLWKDQSVVVVSQRFLAAQKKTELASDNSTLVRLAKPLSGRWKNILTGKILDTSSDASSLDLAAPLSHFPACILIPEKK